MNRNVFVLVLIILSTLTPSCEKEDTRVKVSSISFKETSLNIIEDETNKLHYTIIPENATNKNVLWKSNNPSVIFVDQNGEITANKVGSASIIVTTEDGNKTATCSILVEARIIPVKSISLNSESISLKEGDSELLTTTIEPLNATNKKVVWNSSNDKIITVDQNGIIKALKPGYAIISSTTDDGNRTATCKIQVEENINPIINITLDPIELTMIEGDSEKLKAIIKSHIDSYGLVSWSSSNASIASVDSDGKVKAFKAGTAIITAAINEKKDFCAVLVNPKIIYVDSISLSKSMLDLVVGESDELLAIVFPVDATNKALKWKSSNSKVATIDQNGKVFAHEQGTTTITVTTLDGNKTDECEVTVSTIPVTGIVLNKTSISIDIGESETILAKIEPINSTNKEIKWTSENKNIATVDSNGKVLGVGIGRTRIIATTDDGQKTAECSIHVTKSWINISKQNIEISGSNNSFSIEVDASEEWSVVSKPSWTTISTSNNNIGSGISSVEISASSYNGSTVYRTGEITFKLNNREKTASLHIEQYNFPHKDGDYVKIQSSTRGDGIDLVFLGDGYTIHDIGNGLFRTNLEDAIEHFFDIEPYRTYREYFDVYIVYAFSEESGISDHLTTKNTKFSSRYDNPNTTRMVTNNEKCFDYAMKAPLSSNLAETLITVITNSSRYAGTNWSYSDGKAISIVPVSQEQYPYNFRSILQHEACGHGFGKLADEYVNTNTTIPKENEEDLRMWQRWGFFKNVDFTNDLNKISWNHFIRDEDYNYVGAYEGGYTFAYGVWRPEPKSLMINNITYINAPSRELIVRRIKKLAGETFSYEEFKRKDIRETHSLTRSASIPIDSKYILPPPILINE